MSTILRLVDSFSGRKLVAIALTAITLGIGTKVYASRNPLPVPVEKEVESPTISLSVKNISLEELLRLLKEKSGYYFLYNSNAVRKIKGITMNARHARVETILDKCLAATPFEYVIKDGTTIVIKARKGQEAFVEAADKEEQQKHVIEGVVTSKATKKPLAGVTVYIKGGRHGNITDSEGCYRSLILCRRKHPSFSVSWVWSPRNLHIPGKPGSMLQWSKLWPRLKMSSSPVMQIFGKRVLPVIRSLSTGMNCRKCRKQTS